MAKKDLQLYWKKNLRLLAILLAVWFIVSYGFGIILADQLNHLQIGGYKLGFWFAQQGSIYVFVINHNTTTPQHHNTTMPQCHIAISPQNQKAY